MTSRTGMILSRIDRWDPPAFIFLLHGLSLALAGETDAPLIVSLLSGVLAVIRLIASWLTSAAFARMASAVLSVGLAFAVIVVDGGLESPFFFWVLVLLGWQALTFRRLQFLQIGGVTVAAYLVTLVVTGDTTTASIARLGLLIAFIGALAVGRTILERREAEVRRLDDMMSTLIEEATMAVAILDADRETVLYANPAAHRMGLTSRENMARLILEDPDRLQKVTTLAELVVGAGFQPSPLRAFRPIGSPASEYRIGYHPRRPSGEDSVVLVYGVEIHRGHGPDDAGSAST